MPPEHSARWRGLAASVLRELLIQGAWELPDAEPEVVVVPGDAAAAAEAARQAGGTAVICNPVSAADSAPSPRTGNGCHASRRRSARSRAPGS